MRNENERGPPNESPKAAGGDTARGIEVFMKEWKNGTHGGRPCPALIQY